LFKLYLYLPYEGLDEIKNIILACIWLQIEKPAYFTIQLIFPIIYGPHCTFLVLFMGLLVLFMGLIVLFQLIFTFIYNTFNKKFSISVK